DQWPASPRRPSENDAAIHNRPTGPHKRPQLRRDVPLFSAFDGNLPDLRICVRSFRVIDGFSVGRFECGVTALLCNLDRSPSIRRYFPDLIRARARRGKVNPFAVMRPTGTAIFEFVGG